jgi:hypothetical protein
LSRYNQIPSFSLILTFIVLLSFRQAHTAWGIQGARRRLQAAHSARGPPPGVACPQGAEGLGMVGPGETLGSPWIPLPIRACIKEFFLFPFLDSFSILAIFLFLCCFLVETMISQTLNGVITICSPGDQPWPAYWLPGGWPPSGHIWCFQLILISNVIS